MEYLSVVSSSVSIILAIIAIALSIYLFVQSKNTEKEVTNALSSIKTQVDSLQKLTGRWMDRLTKYATEPKDPFEMIAIVSALQELPEKFAAQISLPIASKSEEIMTDRLIASYISILYYVAVANYAIQGYLPPIEEVLENDYWKRLLDRSYQDYYAIENLLITVDIDRINQNSLGYLYNITINSWKPIVRDSTMVYSARASQSGN